MDIVLASGNDGKIREFSKLLAPLELSVTPQKTLNVSEADETGLSFVENAIIKARHAAQKTGLPALADDSGLVVPALKGEPGIYSARYAGKDQPALAHIDKLLENMKNVHPEERQAYFYCALVFLNHPNDPTPLICTGKWLGVITNEPHGEHGFGYDPIFFIPELNKTAADLTLEEKSKVSHRGLAIQALLKQLPDKLQGQQQWLHSPSNS